MAHWVLSRGSAPIRGQAPGTAVHRARGRWRATQASSSTAIVPGAACRRRGHGQPGAAFRPQILGLCQRWV